MNIKQASKQSGVSAPNIRFYEKEGLLNPARLPGNDYRDYTEQDIRTLRFIRMLRMLDVPLPVIRSVLAGDAPLGSVLREQRPHWNSVQSSWKGRRVFAQNWPGRTRLRRRWMWTPVCPGWKIPRNRRRFSPAGCRITARWRRCSIRSTFSLSRRAASTRRRSLPRPCRCMPRSAGCSSA